MSTFTSFIQKYKLLVILVIVAVLAAVFFLRGDKKSIYETIVVGKSDVIQEVSVTGRVSPDAEVNLAFEKGGRVVSTPRSVGTHVQSGDVLVRLDSSELAAARAQAQANLDYEVAKLAELKKGVRAEDIAVSAARVESAKVAVRDARKNIFDKMAVAYTVADDAVRNKTDEFYRNPRTRNPEFSAPVTDTKIVGDLQQSRVLMEDLLVSWGMMMESWNDTTDVVSAMAQSESSLAQVKDYLEKLGLAVNGILPSSSATQTTIDGWKLDVSTARTNVNGAISSVLIAEQSYRASDQALKISENELALKEAGATPEAVSAQEARITGMKATLAGYDTQIAKTVLVAPFSGVITRQDAKLGQTITPNIPVVALMSDGRFKIEANIPEVDLAKISLGDHARVTLDAYGSDVVFAATVSAIDPAETIVEGVSTYKITLRFDVKDERVRSGMTPNIDISTDKREQVIAIPSRAITTVNGKKVVRVLEGEVPREVTIEVGLRGSDGNVEVLSGLSVGEKVVTFEQK